MAGSVNKVILVGNLGKDPEIRATQTGGKVANLTLATSENRMNKQSGQREDNTEWHRLIMFNQTAEIAEKYLKKGSKIFAEGACRPASGPIRKTKSVTPPKFWWTTSPCWTASVMVKVVVTTTKASVRAVAAASASRWRSRRRFLRKPHLMMRFLSKLCRL